MNQPHKNNIQAWLVSLPERPTPTKYHVTITGKNVYFQEIKDDDGLILAEGTLAFACDPAIHPALDVYSRQRNGGIVPPVTVYSFARNIRKDVCLHIPARLLRRTKLYR